mgnify:CR=1 FL=1
MPIDEKDWSILDALRENAKLSRQQLARKTGLPVMTVHNRIRKLEREGVIKQYTVLLDHKKLGKALSAYMLVHVDTSVLGKGISREEYLKRLKVLPGIEEVKSITGHFDVLLKFRLRDMDELRDTLVGKLRKIPGVGNTETIFVLDDIK